MYLQGFALTILAVIATGLGMAAPHFSQVSQRNYRTVERQGHAAANNSPALSYAQLHPERPVRPWVRISRSPVNAIEAVVGSRVELECVAEGSPPPQVAWYSGSSTAEVLEQQLRANAQLSYDPNAEWKGIGGVVSKLVIDCLSPTDGDLIYCAAVSDLEVAVSSPAAIIVNNDPETNLNCSTSSKPTITLYATSIVTNMGLTAVLPCRATGNPAPTITWQDAYENVVDSSTHTRHRVLDNGDLVIEQLAWEDMGVYTCKAKAGLNEEQVGTFVYPMNTSTPVPEGVVRPTN